MGSDLLSRYWPVVWFGLFCLLVPLGTYVATRFIRPHHPTPLKDLTYECGEVPEGEAMIQFHFQYYVFALIFVVFDVAAVFLLLWALSSGPGLPANPAVAPVAFVSIVLFVAIMFVATNYALKKEEVLYV